MNQKSRARTTPSSSPFIGLQLQGQQQEPEPAHPAYCPPKTCVCPSGVGPRECIAIRYNRDYSFGENTGLEEECECSCHEADWDDGDEELY